VQLLDKDEKLTSKFIKPVTKEECAVVQVCIDKAKKLFGLNSAKFTVYRDYFEDKDFSDFSTYIIGDDLGKRTNEGYSYDTVAHAKHEKFKVISDPRAASSAKPCFKEHLHEIVKVLFFRKMFMVSDTKWSNILVGYDKKVYSVDEMNINLKSKIKDTKSFAEFTLIRKISKMNSIIDKYVEDNKQTFSAMLESWKNISINEIDIRCGRGHEIKIKKRMKDARDKMLPMLQAFVA
jgi:hypothetical protein